VPTTRGGIRSLGKASVSTEPACRESRFVPCDGLRPDGLLVGLRAQQFDDVALYQTFVLTALIFLGGVFYSASLLPEPFATLTHVDPV
jgi:hypothetical protein